MEVPQLMSPIEFKDLRKADADLEAFMAEFMSGDQSEPMVTWDEIEINEELPTTVTQGMPFRTVCDVLDEYVNRDSIKQSVVESRKIEAQATDINCFDLKLEFNSPDLNQYFEIKKPKITAVIDWLRLEIVIGEGYKFKRPTKPYDDIKDFLRAKGISDEPYVVQSSHYRWTFTIDLHDVSTGNEYNNVLNQLREEYQPSLLKVVTLEVSLDFQNIKAKPFLLALAKAIRVDERLTNTDLRIYKDSGLFMPNKSETAMKYAQDCYSIGIGHKDQGDLYVRIYYKMRDRDQELPQDQHRMRIEINVRGQTLVDLGNDATNLKYLANESFKILRFTHLTDDATAEQKAEYRKFMGLFGKEISVISKSRNKRKYPDHIESHAELNRAISKAVSNFIRKF